MALTPSNALFVLWSTIFICRAGAERVCYPLYGCFSAADFRAKYSSLPSHPNVIQTRFYLFTRKNPMEAQVLNPANISSVRSTNFDSSQKTIFIVHGFAHHSYKPWVIRMKNALLRRNGCNVINVDWRKGASYVTMFYLKAVANTHLVGAQIAHLIHALNNSTGLPSQSVHIIGHSLGAHVAGFAGKRLSRNNLILGRISALDPARPEFEGAPAAARLNKTDASFVDVIHTNAAPFLLGGAGYRQQLGHIDFYPNGGEYQPGCPGFFQTIWRKGILNAASCHHMRAVDYFTTSIRRKCLFPAFPCDSWQEFTKRKCFNKFLTRDISFMGMPADQSNKHEQPMYLTTIATYPFCVYNYVIQISYSRCGKAYNSVYVQLTGKKRKAKKAKIQLNRGTGTELEVTTDNNDIGELTSVELFYYGFDSFFIHNVRVNILHRNEVYISCFEKNFKNNFWFFWRLSEAKSKRKAFLGEDCDSIHA